MKQRLLFIGSKIVPKPFIPFLRPLKNKIFPQPKPIILFEGWGMSTEHQVPWIDDTEFQKTNEIIKQRFIFDGVLNTGDINMDWLLWRHWNVIFCIRYVMKHSKSNNFVECGVAAGVSAYFALTVLKDTSCTFHLYDSWEIMKSEYLYDTEKQHIGKYEGQSIQNTKKNLEQYSEKIKYHPGYIPEILDSSASDEISYLHIDVNSAKTTNEILEFFYTKLVSGGVILFDDYGWIAHNETKKVVDDFLEDKDGILFVSPTGQSIFYNS